MGAVRGLTPQDARARALRWLERFGITGYARTPLDELSKGTCQKVAVTQALMADPLLLVLDEAWTGLDAEARAVLDEAVRERAAAGATVLFVDHDPGRLADAATAVHPVLPTAPSPYPAAPAAAGVEAAGAAVAWYGEAPGGATGLGGLVARDAEGAGPTAAAGPEEGAAAAEGAGPEEAPGRGATSVSDTGAGGAVSDTGSDVPGRPVDGVAGVDAAHEPISHAATSVERPGVGGAEGAPGSAARSGTAGDEDDPRAAAAGPGEAPGVHRADRVGGARAGASVVIEAVGEGPVPAGAGGLAATGERGVVRGVVAAERSDAVLRALLGARPPWHVTSVRTTVPSVRPVSVPPAASGAATPAGTAVRARGTGALLRYQLDLLLRSHRWLPPLIFYGAVMAIGIAGGEPLLGSLGYAAALLLPVAAWTVRVCVTNEPAAARACVAAAAGPARVQRAALAAAAVAAGVLGLAGTAVVTAVSGPHADDLHTAVPVGPAALAGAMAAAVSVLLGTAVGALTNPPLVRGGSWPILVTAIAAGAVLIVSGSPAQAAVTGLVTGSRTGTVHYPLPALLAAAAAAFAATRISAWAATRLTP
jgi:hypothetical protein